MLFRFFRLTTRVRDLEDEVRELRSGFKQIEIEWADTFDKVRSVLGKIAKRQQRIDAEQPSEPTQPELVGSDPVSQQIRALRGSGRHA